MCAPTLALPALLFALTADAPAADPSPVDLVVTRDGRSALVVNRGTGTLVEIDVATGRITAQAPCGRRPAAVALTPDENHVLVSAPYSGEVFLFHRGPDHLKEVARIDVGFEPHGLAVAPDGGTAFVALTTAHAVAVLDLKSRTVTDRIPVGRWPRSLALTGDGTRLAVGLDGEGGIGVVDVAEKKLLWTEAFSGLNFGQMQTDRAGRYVYFPWIVYRHNPITPGNVREGWVLASRLARVRLDGPARREAISLDARGQAVADPHGLALSPDEETLVVAASGSHELLVYRRADLPFRDYGGPGDHIDPALLKDSARFRRIPLNGRPMAVRYLPDGHSVLVADYLGDAVQVVDVAEGKVTRTIALGGPAEPTAARRGEAIFYDGRRSLDQWYSCHSCHHDGHTNAVTMDTRNDGRFGNFKTVLSLRGAPETGPWFWHGYENDLGQAVRRSMIDTMLGKTPTERDVSDVVAFLARLDQPANPHRTKHGGLSDAARRGEQVFRGEKANCARCHPGPQGTDGRVHLVGTEERGDVYKGYNPPALPGVYGRIRLLHDGRATTLEELLRGPHNPDRVTGRGELSESELQDLLAYLRSL